MILTVIGVTFYRVVLHWEFREALLEVVQTVTTLGGSVRVVDPSKQAIAQWFSIFFVLMILLVVLWGISLLIEATVRGDLVYYWGARRMERRIAQLSKHYIICGFGRMGQEIARQLDRAKQPYVVVEHNAHQLPNLEATGCLFVKGDAREDEQLMRAGVERAKGLIAVAATDEENVYITLSARVLSPNIYIVTRCSNAQGEAKLIRAGANRVISPYVFGGRRMAQAILRPSVVDFLDTITHGDQMELVLEEVVIEAEAPILGHAIRGGEFDVEELGIHLLGISTRSGHMMMSGLDRYKVMTGDTLILLGEPTSMATAVKRLTGKNVSFADQVMV